MAGKKKIYSQSYRREAVRLADLPDRTAAGAARKQVTHLRHHRLVLMALSLFFVSCATADKTTASSAWRKIEIDLSVLDENGLRGPADGKVSVAYEFCIPDTDKCKAEVRAIDPAIEFSPGTRGRIGAGKDQCLCIGHTRKDYRKVLLALAALPYVERIVECHFE